MSRFVREVRLTLFLEDGGRVEADASRAAAEVEDLDLIEAASVQALRSVERVATEKVREAARRHVAAGGIFVQPPS